MSFSVGPISLGPDQYGISIAGATVLYGDPAIVGVQFAPVNQQVGVLQDPLIFSFDPPIASISEISLPAIVDWLVKQNS